MKECWERVAEEDKTRVTMIIVSEAGRLAIEGIVDVIAQLLDAFVHPRLHS